MVKAVAEAICGRREGSHPAAGDHGGRPDPAAAGGRRRHRRPQHDHQLRPMDADRVLGRVLPRRARSSWSARTWPSRASTPSPSWPACGSVRPTGRPASATSSTEAPDGRDRHRGQPHRVPGEVPERRGRCDHRRRHRARRAWRPRTRTPWCREQDAFTDGALRHRRQRGRTRTWSASSTRCWSRCAPTGPGRTATTSGWRRPWVRGPASPDRSTAADHDHRTRGPRLDRARRSSRPRSRTTCATSRTGCGPGVPSSTSSTRRLWPPTVAAEVAADMMLSLSAWKAVSDRYQLIFATWDGGRVLENERLRISSLIWGRLDGASDLPGGLAVSLPEACRLSDALVAQLRTGSRLVPGADASAARIKQLRAQLGPAARPGGARAGERARARPSGLADLAGRLAEVTDKAQRGADVGGHAQPARDRRHDLRARPDRRQRPASRRPRPADQRPRAARRPRVAGVRAGAAGEQCVRTVDPAPHYAVPDVDALGPVPNTPDAIKTYLQRLERVARGDQPRPAQVRRRAGRAHRAGRPARRLRGQGQRPRRRRADRPGRERAPGPRGARPPSGADDRVSAARGDVPDLAHQGTA